MHNLHTRDTVDGWVTYDDAAKQWSDHRNCDHPFFDKATDSEIVRFQLDPSAHLPQRATEGAAGYDLVARETVYFQQGQLRMIDTGVHVDSPVPMMLKLRSSMVKRGFMMPDWGLVDADYRGSLFVSVIYNGWPVNMRDPLAGKIEAGERIAQLVFFKAYMPTPVVTLGLSETVRGEGGWGSTGR